MARRPRVSLVSGKDAGCGQDEGVFGLQGDVDTMSDDEIEWFSWPLERRGGQHVVTVRGGVLAVHSPTGIACVVEESRSQMGNREIARHRLRELIQGWRPL